MQAPREMSAILQQLKLDQENKTQFDEGWLQGRSAFGGLAAAFAVTAMDKQLETAIPLRSLMVSFIAPLPAGEVQVNVRRMRQGKNVTQFFAEVCAGGEVCLQAMAVFGQAREALAVAVSHPVEFKPRDQGVPLSRHAKRTPPFLQAFEGCWTDKGMPFSGSKQLDLSMWVRHRDDMSAFPNEKIIALADIPPPVILNQFEKPPVPASSLTWSLEFVKPPMESNADWYYLQFTVEAAKAGYTQQSGKLFDDSGELCALSRQTMVYFG